MPLQNIILNLLVKKNPIQQGTYKGGIPQDSAFAKTKKKLTLIDLSKHAVTLWKSSI